MDVSCLRQTYLLRGPHKRSVCPDRREVGMGSVAVVASEACDCPLFTRNGSQLLTAEVPANCMRPQLRDDDAFEHG